MARVSLSDEIIEGLTAQRRRTDVGAGPLLAGRDDVPDGLRADHVTKWMTRIVGTAPRAHLLFVQKAWESLPDDPRVDITEAMRDTLKAETQRSGVGTVRLVKEFGPLPDGLSAHSVHGWINGAIKSVKQRHFEHVLGLYKTIPDTLANTKRPVEGRLDRVEVTVALREELRALHTGKPQNYLHEAPAGFTAVTMAQVLSGRNKTISTEVLEYLRNHSGAPPPATPRGPDKDLTIPPRSPSKRPLRQVPGTTYVAITDEIYEQLHREVHRTGLSPAQLLHGQDEIPKGLTARLISTWLYGTAQSAEAHYLWFVLEGYDALPDA
ncbi:MAG: hypothetical protein Kilf2KO_28530 [Rhodospirillales bacterium]